MAAEGDPLQAQNEALFLVRRWLSSRSGQPVDLGSTFTLYHGARLERAYGEQLFSWLNDPANAEKYGISIDSINDSLRNDPAIAARFARPLDNSMGISEHSAVQNGMTLKDGEGNPLRDATGRLMVRTFFAIDKDGYIYQTLPEGAPLTRPGQLGTIYSGLGAGAVLPQLVAEIAGRQIQKSLRIDDPGFFNTLQGLDGLLDLQARKEIMGTDDQNELARTDADLGLYRALGAMDEASLRNRLAQLVEQGNPLPAEPAGDAAAKETPEQKSQRLQALNEKKQKNTDTTEQYFMLMQRLKGLADNDLRAVLQVNDSRRMEGFISQGAIRPGLSLGGPLSRDAPWQPDPGLDQGRLRMWDKVGFGDVYQRLTGRIYNDLSVTEQFKIGRDELLSNITDEQFQQLLGKMDLPEVVDIQQFNKVSTVLYAYQVLKHEGKLNDSGALDRLAAMYKGQGEGLNGEERQAVANSLNGRHASGKPPYVINSKWDLPLMQYNGKAGETPQQQNRESQAHLRWFEESLNVPVSLPGGEAVKSTISGDQAARLFWLFDAGAVAGFPHEKLNRPVSRADRAKIEQGGRACRARRPLQRSEDGRNCGVVFTG
ncbi:MAG: hypothetical protein LRY54_00545 [Alphaproteobacteria bacterium]|nr:hypothetical protein [Alphaproteobacteria bacterium]